MRTPSEIGMVGAMVVLSFIFGWVFRSKKPTCSMVSNVVFRQIIEDVINKTVPTMLAEYTGRFRNIVREVINEPLTDEEQAEYDDHLRKVIREELAAALGRPTEFFPAIATQGQFTKEMVDAIQAEAKERKASPAPTSVMHGWGHSIQTGEATAQPREGTEVPPGATGEISSELSPTEAARQFGGMVRFGRYGIGMTLALMASACSLTIEQVEEVERGEFIPAPGIRDAIVSAINPPWETRERMLKLYEIVHKAYLGREQK